MRIGVLYSDGSINVMADRDARGRPRSDKGAIEEAVRESRLDGTAKVVSIDLAHTDVVELGPEDLR